MVPASHPSADDGLTLTSPSTAGARYASLFGEAARLAEQTIADVATCSLIHHSVMPDEQDPHVEPALPGVMRRNVVIDKQGYRCSVRRRFPRAATREQIRQSRRQRSAGPAPLRGARCRQEVGS